MQHGQKITTLPKQLLAQAGFTVKDVPEGHLCCGSAGTYNILQPEIALQLRDRKVANIERTAPDVIATGNIGCITQIGSGTAIPIVHTVELLDWATGGPRPTALAATSVCDGRHGPRRHMPPRHCRTPVAGLTAPADGHVLQCERAEGDAMTIVRNGTWRLGSALVAAAMLLLSACDDAENGNAKAADGAAATRGHRRQAADPPADRMG